MCKTKCPRCKNEELKGTENYCPICGLDLKATAQEVPVQEQPKFIPEYSNRVLKRKEISNLSNKVIKFKKLVLATGEEFDNGILDFEDDYLEECLPNKVTVILGKQKIIINADFILSVEK